MAPITNGRLLFNEVPAGYPEPGKTTVYDTSQTIDLETVPLNGGILVKTLQLSIDPYIRGKMRSGEDPSLYTIGEPANNHGIGLVIRSEFPGVKVGDHVYGILDFVEYAVKSNLDNLQVLRNQENLPWSVYLGVAGMPGKTAYMGWKEYAAPQKGDVVFVSTGAGPVGSLVVQLAKLHGLKVIASAGSEQKVKFLKEIGADVAFNYKIANTREVLMKEGPINIYWDNVGGEILEAALDAAAINARIIICGSISGYNGQVQPIRNLTTIIGKTISIFGMFVVRLQPKYEEEFYRIIPAKVAKGEIKYTEDVTKGLENAGHAILAVQLGTNTGKSVVLVADK